MANNVMIGVAYGVVQNVTRVSVNRTNTEGSG